MQGFELPGKRKRGLFTVTEGLGFGGHVLHSQSNVEDLLRDEISIPHI